jgi:hypothetical protein
MFEPKQWRIIEKNMEFDVTVACFIDHYNNERKMDKKAIQKSV